jgi:formate hydrogenlyase subunit 3/multisubunit Na+/H+ antiporter MnhD subunit
MKNTKRSFHYAIISSVLLVMFTILSQTTRTVDNNINDITGYLMTLFFVTIFMGFFFSMMSIKEKYHWKKYIGLGINFFLLIMTGIALAGNLKDIIKVFG